MYYKGFLECSYISNLLIRKKNLFYFLVMQLNMYLWILDKVASDKVASDKVASGQSSFRTK